MRLGSPVCNDRSFQRRDGCRNLRDCDDALG